MSFQKNLRYYRQKAGYNQAKEFAHMVDIPYTTYSGYENSQNRKPSFENLIKIADGLNISLDELLGRTPKNEDFNIMIMKRFTKVD